MATHGTSPRKKAARRPTATPSGSATTTAPRTEAEAGVPAGGEAAAGRNTAAARRLRRRLLALKATIYVLVAGCLSAIGLAIRQVTLQPMLAGVYVGLASVGVAGIGVCVTVYLHIRRKDDSDDDT